jgi:DNA-binding NtrC family response regulator
MSTVLAEVVRLLGHEASVFRSPAQCLDWLNDHDADLALFDIQMGETNGLDLFRRVDQLGIDLPIVFVTGDPQGELAQEAWRRGALGILGKPVSIDLVQRVFELAWPAEEEREAPAGTGDPESGTDPARPAGHGEPHRLALSDLRRPVGGFLGADGDGAFAGARSLREQLARARQELRQQEGMA